MNNEYDQCVDEVDVEIKIKLGFKICIFILHSLFVRECNSQGCKCKTELIREIPVQLWNGKDHFV